MNLPFHRGSLSAGIVLAFLSAVPCLRAAHGWSQAHKSSQTATAKINRDAPLPSTAELKQRVLENLKKSQPEQERYVCRPARENDATDKNGNVKRKQVKQY